MDCNVVKKRGTNTIDLSNSLQELFEDQEQLNGQADQDATDAYEEMGFATPVEGVSRAKEKEVTMEFGKRLGVDLTEFDQLVSKIIEGEGLQSGDR